MAAPVSTVALLAAPFPSHEGHGAATAAHGFPVLASVGLYALVVLAGTLAAPALSRSRTSGSLRSVVVSAIALAYVAQNVRHQMSMPASAGVLTAIGVALVALRRGAYAEQLGAAAVLVATQVPVVGTDDGVTHLSAVLLHLVAAAVWIGGVLHVVLVTATEGRAPGAQVARRFTVFAVPSTAFLIGSGVVLMLVHHIGRVVLTGSTYGHVLLAKMGFLALAVAIGFTMRRRATAQPGRWWPRLIRIEAVALASALGLGALLVGLADPEPAVTRSAPGLAHVQMGAESGTLFLVSRDRTSAWLQYVAGDDDAPAVRISDGAHQWQPSNDGAQLTTVKVRDGQAHLSLTYDETTLHFTLPVTQAVEVSANDPATADLAGRLQFGLGRSLAQAASADSPRVDVATGFTSTPSTAEQGLSLGRTLRGLGVRAAHVVGDNSTRARSFAAGLRRSIATSASSRTLVLTGDSESALSSLAHVGLRATGGIYLAPWLLNGAVLAATGERALPLVAVASVVDPMTPLADRYRGLLATLASRAQPSEAGLLGFLSVAAPDQAAQSLRVYAAAPVGFLPGILNVGHTHEATGWFANGTLAPISTAQPLAATTPCEPRSQIVRSADAPA
jgi:putative copper export protein